MIARLKGAVAEKFAGSVIVDVNGVGYEVRIPVNDFSALGLGDEVTLHIFHHITDRSQELFGFTSLASKKIFELLISVNGVGPKAGLAILSLGSSEEVRNAIAGGDATFISRASGVGKRSAERVIVDLSDKVGGVSSGRVVGALPVQQDDAIDALIALGYTLNDATIALKDVSKDLPINERVKIALKG